MINSTYRSDTCNAETHGQQIKKTHKWQQPGKLAHPRKKKQNKSANKDCVPDRTKNTQENENYYWTVSILNVLYICLIQVEIQHIQQKKLTYS